MAKILICGDSQSVNPGATAVRKLKALGHTAERVSNIGMGPYDYVRIKGLWDEYVGAVRKLQPDLVFLIFGSNDAPDKHLEDALKRLKQAVKPKVVLSGPPQYPDPENQARGAKIRDSYRTVFGVDYFDSYPYTGVKLSRAKDGLHFTPKGATPWGEAIAAEIVRRVLLQPST